MPTYTKTSHHFGKKWDGSLKSFCIWGRAAAGVLEMESGRQ